MVRSIMAENFIAFPAIVLKTICSHVKSADSGKSTLRIRLEITRFVGKCRSL